MVRKKISFWQTASASCAGSAIDNDEGVEATEEAKGVWNGNATERARKFVNSEGLELENPVLSS